MAVVLSARLMVRYADKYDPDLAAAFEKLERGLPPPLAEHVERTLDGLSKAPRDERFSANVRLLTRAWAERRVVTIDYEPARYESGAVPRRATVRPFLLEPSLQTHALYLIGFDEERGALRTFKIERIRSAALTPRTFEPPDPAATTSALRAAWDIIADQEPVEIVLRFVPGVAARVREAIWHPTQTLDAEADGSLRWRATVSGTIEIRLWILSWGDEVEVLAPAVVARRRGRHASAGARALCRRGAATTREHDAGGRDRCGHEAVMRRHPFAAVNLISDPIHGYVELTKRLTAPESTAAGLPAEDVAEEDLLDTAWLQRLRRISQLQSARWVFPTAEHSRFTHGLGVMHEAGLWARALYPSLRSTLAGLGEPVPSEGLAVETLRMAGLLHDVGHGPFAHFFDDHVLAAFDAPADARRPAGKRLTHEDLSGRIIEDELGPLLAGLRRAPGAVAERDAFADDEAIDPALGVVPRLQAGPRRPVDAALGALAPAAPVGRVHRRQPRLRPARCLPDRRRRRPGRRRAAAPLFVHHRARADPVRAGAARPRDVPHLAPVHVPAGLLPPDGARHRPRPRGGLRPVDPVHLRRGLAGRPAGRLRRPRRVRPPPSGGPLGARRGPRRSPGARRRHGQPGRRGGLAGDPPAPADVAVRGGVPGRVRSRRAARGPDRGARGRRSPAAWRSTWPRWTPGPPTRPRPTPCSRSRRATAPRPRSPRRSPRSPPTGSSPAATGAAT